jgi:hypothetical protein
MTKNRWSEATPPGRLEESARPKRSQDYADGWSSKRMLKSNWKSKKR